MQKSRVRVTAEYALSDLQEGAKALSIDIDQVATSKIWKHWEGMDK